jgi:hypothetical protein
MRQSTGCGLLGSRRGLGGEEGDGCRGDKIHCRSKRSRFAVVSVAVAAQRRTFSVISTRSSAISTDDVQEGRRVKQLHVVFAAAQSFA